MVDFYHVMRACEPARPGRPGGGSRLHTRAPPLNACTYVRVCVCV